MVSVEVFSDATPNKKIVWERSGMFILCDYSGQPLQNSEGTVKMAFFREVIF